jgi:hypothetical protein
MRLHQLLQRDLALFPLLGVIEKREAMGTRLGVVVEDKEVA